jgi:hypothetical protein
MTGAFLVVPAEGAGRAELVVFARGGGSVAIVVVAAVAAAAGGRDVVTPIVGVLLDEAAEDTARLLL